MQINSIPQKKRPFPPPAGEGAAAAAGEGEGWILHFVRIAALVLSLTVLPHPSAPCGADTFPRWGKDTPDLSVCMNLC